MTDQTLKIPERKYTFMISTQKEGGEEVDKIGHVFVDSIILNIRSFSADSGSGKVMYVCIYIKNVWSQSASVIRHTVI